MSEPRKLSIAILGATGRTGLQLVSQALEKSFAVTVLVRSPAKLGELRGRVTIVEGSTTDPSAVDRAVAGCDAVLSALGHVRGSPGNLLSVSSSNIVGAMKNRGLKRLVVLTNTAVSDPSDRPPLVHLFVKGALLLMNGEMRRDALEEARKVAESGLDWTLVRAPILTDGPMTGWYKVGHLAKGMPLRVSRADVAHFMLTCAAEGKYVGERPVVSGPD